MKVAVLTAFGGVNGSRFRKSQTKAKPHQVLVSHANAQSS